MFCLSRSRSAKITAEILKQKLNISEQFLKGCSIRIPEYIRKECGQVDPKWKAPAESFFTMWPKLSMCQPKYEAFLKSCRPEDLKSAHVFMNNAASAELAEYYLCAALLLRPKTVEAAGDDNQKLLELAEKVASEDVEPVMKGAQELGIEYSEEIHRAIEELTVWREVDDALFWEHSFSQLTPTNFELYLKEMETTCDAKSDTVEVPPLETDKQKELAKDCYMEWLDLAGMPIRGTIRNCLLDYHHLHGVDRAWEGVKFQERTKRAKPDNVKEATFD